MVWRSMWLGVGRSVHVVGVWRSGWLGVLWSGGVGVSMFHSFAMGLVISSITVICEIRKR